MKSRHLLLRLLPILAAALLIMGFVRLGFWQLDRAQFKEELFEAIAQSDANPVPIDKYQSLPDYTRVTLDGTFVDPVAILLDNRTRDGQVGVEVFALIQPRTGGPNVLVNRGWLAAPQDRSLAIDVPALKIEESVQGILAPPPAAGIKMGEVDWTLSEPYLRVPYIDIEALAKGNSLELAPQVLMLTAGDAAPLLRDWQPQTMTPDKHRGYAFQWFALAVAVFIVTLVVQLRRKNNASE